jgi:hypothetical protein
VDQDGNSITSRPGLTERFTNEDLAEPITVGEGPYLQQHVLPTIADQPIGEVTRRQLGGFPNVNFPMVGSNSLHDAVGVAVDLIESASRMTERVPPSSGIGGPVDVRVLGKEARPARWQRR